MHFRSVFHEMIFTCEQDGASHDQHKLFSGLLWQACACAQVRSSEHDVPKDLAFPKLPDEARWDLQDIGVCLWHFRVQVDLAAKQGRVHSGARNCHQVPPNDQHHCTAELIRAEGRLH